MPRPRLQRADTARREKVQLPMLNRIYRFCERTGLPGPVFLLFFSFSSADPSSMIPRIPRPPKDPLVEMVCGTSRLCIRTCSR